MGWKIAYLLLAIGAIVYLIGFFSCFISLLGFKRKLAKRIAALSIVFSEKREVLLALDTYYREAKMECSEADLECVRKVAAMQEKRIKDTDVPFYYETLSSLEKRLRYLADSNSWIKAGDDFETMLSLLSDLNGNYRRIAAVYNSDLLGYEYWRKQIFYRLWFFLFGFRKKERIH